MADDIIDLPFRAEYAKSNRAACKACKNKIDKSELRLAVMVQSPHFDGKVPNWHHCKCFFLRNRPKAVGDIAHYDDLRWEDQENITKMLNDALVGGPPISGKGGKKGGKADKNGVANSGGGLSAHGTIMKDFRLELAKSGASKCGVCDEKIKKNEVRVGKKIYDSQRAKMYGPYDKWHMVECFVKNREELEYFDSGEAMAGFMTLGPEDQELVKTSIKAMKRKNPENGVNGKDEPDSKKIKIEKEDPKEKEALKKQMKKIFYYRDLLEKMKKSELQDLLEANKQEIPVGEGKMLDRLADCMTFGALLPCPECKEGQLVFRSGVGYQCVGNVSEWTKCQYTTNDPKRKAFKVPDEFRQGYAFLNMYKPKEGLKRIIPHNPTTVKPVETAATSKSAKDFPLKNAIFVLDESLKGDKREKLKEKIKAFGGERDNRVSSTKTLAVIATKEALEKEESKLIKAAKEKKIQVVSPEVLDNVKVEGIISNIKTYTISSWGTTDPQTRLKKEENSKEAKKSGSMFIKKEMPKSVKMKLKGGGFVDPDSGLEDKAHVYKIGNALYSVVLGAVSIQDDVNSYYKLQVLEHDKKPKYYVFRSWGRVGTTIGGNKVENFYEKADAVREFERLYEEKTGNRWSKRHEFKKVAGRFYPLEMDYGQDNDQIKKLSVAESKSKLAKPIQELVSTIFDIESMKKALVEFEIDLTKMPLGKLSKKQIETAYTILTEAQDMIKNEDGTDTKFLDASNRFFTLIPHDFGMKKPPILNNPDIVKNKIEMLDNLLEIEVAYSLLKDTGDENANKGKDPIDVHYEKLKTEIEVVDKNSNEFEILKKYVENTHAATHNLFALEIEDIFKVNRKGENKRFKPFKKLPNRKLLWHGSRTTNYAGILSQGLRIAPPEAPVTGYMFGKGVYFADMVSKSANYCNTTRSNNTGLLLLCDVALGNMYERTKADYIEKLPTGKHSTKGVGKTAPDPSEKSELDGAEVPHGKGCKQEGVAKTDLLYNEYIVYDVGQVNCKYLLKLKFNYKI